MTNGLRPLAELCMDVCYADFAAAEPMSALRLAHSYVWHQRALRCFPGARLRLLQWRGRTQWQAMCLLAVFWWRLTGVCPGPM